MDTRITELLEEIKKAIDKAATTGDKYQFIDPVFDLTDELEQCETPFDAVRPILELIELAMRTKSWTGKGQECTHTRNGCEQSKHTSHPDIKRTRRSRSWDTHLTRRCVAGIGNIRKVEICTGISSGRLCIHRSKRRRRWPTIMPMGATIRKPLRPWDMSTGIVCGNGCWKRGRRRDRLVCRGEMS